MHHVQVSDMVEYIVESASSKLMRAHMDVHLTLTNESVGSDPNLGAVKPQSDNGLSFLSLKNEFQT